MKKKKENASPEMRSLKIHSQFRKTKSSYKFIPEIKLCGNWLEKTGFVKGERISIAALDKLLIVRLEEK